MEQKKRPVRKKPSKKTRLLLSSLAKSQCPIKPPSSSSSSSSSCKVQTCGQIPILRARFPPKFRVLVPSSFSRPCPQFQGSLAPTYVLALYSAFPRQEKTFLEEKKNSLGEEEKYQRCPSHILSNLLPSLTSIKRLILKIPFQMRFSF